MIDLNKLSKESYITAKKRELNGAKIKADTISMLKHCATEVIEATEAFLNYKEALNFIDDSVIVDECQQDFENEIADIIVCCLIISGYSMIDIEKAVNRVMEKNKLRAKKMGDKL